MCFHYDYDGYNLISSVEIVHAGCSHVCDCCRDSIRVNETHCVEKGLYDGHWSCTRFCNRCERTRLRIVATELAEGCEWETAWPNSDDLSDYMRQAEQFEKPISPLGLPTLWDCRRYVFGIETTCKLMDENE